jgi:hypothetical protein
MATTFIIIVSLIICVCIALAVIVGFFMHTNNGLNSGELEQAGDVQANTTPIDTTHTITGPLPPFMLNPTQPLSEIYYHDEQTSTPAPLTTPSQPLQPPNIPLPPGPQPTGPLPPGPQPTGPLPIYHNNQ